ncbi:MAG: cytochrome c peroxidase [Polyangiaceae bacterium]
MRGAHYTFTFLTLALFACSSNSAGGGNAGSSAAGGGSAGSDSASDGPPALSAAELGVLRSLSPDTLPPVGPDISNRFADNPGAAAFGQRLFFDPGFSGKLLDGDNDGSMNALGRVGDTGKVACAGCHVPSAGFVDNRSLGEQVSLAAGWGRRKAPSLLDVAQAPLVTWDGRRDALYNQPFAPIESPIEMNSSRLFAAEQLYARHRSEYEAIFGAMPPLDDAQRFPQLSAAQTGCHPSHADTEPQCNGTEDGVPGDGAEFDGLSAADQDLVTGVVVNAGKALGAYERLLTCGPGRFDQWMHGQTDALSVSEQRGAQLFVGRGQCVNCHSGPFLSDQKFHNVGLQPAIVAVVFLDSDDSGASVGLAAAVADPLNVRGHFSDGDDGRLPSAVGPELLGAFRTPMLRCGATHPSFMHTGQLSTLSAVVGFFARGGDTFGFPGKSEIAPLELTAQDQVDLVAFLKALAGPGPANELLTSP